MEHLIKSIGTIDFNKQEDYEVDTTGVKTVNKITFTLTKKEFTEFKEAYDTFTFMSSKPELLKMFRDLHGQNSTSNDLNEKLIKPFDSCMASIAKKKHPKKSSSASSNPDSFYSKLHKPTPKYIKIAKALGEEIEENVTIPMANSLLKRYALSDKFSMEMFKENKIVVNAESFKNRSILVTVSKEVIGFVPKGN